MNIGLWPKRKKAGTACAIILGVILIIFLWNYFFSMETNWKIYSKNIVVPFSASQVIYYGPDINSNDQNYSGRRGADSVFFIPVFILNLI